MISIAPYRKTVASIIGSVLTWVGTAYVPDGHVDRYEWYALAVALAGVVGVYAVANAVKPTPEPVAPTPMPTPEPPIITTPIVPLVAAVRRTRAERPAPDA